MLQLFSHPFSSYCQKVLIALWENEVPFTYRNLEEPRRPLNGPHCGRWDVFPSYSMAA